MEINKISAHPPIKKSAQEFILEGKNSIPLQDRLNDTVYPWEEAHVRPDLNKGLTINLPEDYILKIKYLSEKGIKESQQKIVRDIIIKGVDELLAKVRGHGL